MDRCFGCGEDISVFEGQRIAHLASICIANLRQRIEELESKLGAAAAEQTASASGVPEGPAVRLGGPGVSGTAAPSVSLGSWRDIAHVNRVDGHLEVARACDLAAAVTEWWSDDENNVGGADYEQRLFDVVTAFVRGEPLPQKGG